MFAIHGNGITAPVISTNNEYKRNALGIYGGAFELRYAKLIETGSIYESIGARYGGLFYCYECSFTFDGATFTNVRAYEGGIWNIR